MEKTKPKPTTPEGTIRCPRCLSRQIYYRSRSSSFACQKCGAIWPASWAEGPRVKVKGKTR